MFGGVLGSKPSDTHEVLVNKVGLMADLRERLGLSLRQASSSFPFDVVGFVVPKGTESLLSHDEQKCYNTKLFDF